MLVSSPISQAIRRRPSIAFCIAAVWLLQMGVHCAAQSENDLPLPRWIPELARPPDQRRDVGRQFNQLLPPESNLLPPPVEVQGMLDTGPRLEDGVPSLWGADSELGSQDLTLFLHGSALNQTASAPPTPAVSLRDLPKEMVESVCRAPAEDYLLDPQSLVPEVPAQDLDRLLEFHAKDARIRLFVLVLDGDQKLPEGAALDRIAQGALTKRDACLAIYPLGEPWRARFMVSQSVHGAVSVRSLTDLAEDCIKDARQAADSVQQLHRFAVRLSTRLFSLEKVLPPALAKQTAPVPLQEVAQGGVALASAAQAGAVSPAAVAATAGVSVTALLFLAALFGAFVYCMRCYRRGEELSRVWILPEQEVAARLGGAFSGGAGAVVHYGREG
jgi:hypothetical protein